MEGTSRKRETRCEDAEGTGTSRETERERTKKEGEGGGAVAEVGASARRQEEKTRVCAMLFHIDPMHDPFLYAQLEQNDTPFRDDLSSIWQELI